MQIMMIILKGHLIKRQKGDVFVAVSLLLVPSTESILKMTFLFMLLHFEAIRSVFVIRKCERENTYYINTEI